MNGKTSVSRYSKLTIVALISIFYSGSIYADINLAAHQFHHMDMSSEKCINIASSEARKFKFQFNDRSTYGGSNYKLIWGFRDDGYTFQYTCVPNKKFAYLIISGDKQGVRNKLRDNLGDSIKKAAKN
jgi:hypothetical protein